jgi:hypothetical protein
MERVTRLIVEKLRLKVNGEKSAPGESAGAEVSGL